MTYPTVGRTNLIIYPRKYLLPEEQYLDDGSINPNYKGEPNDSNSFIYALDHNDRHVVVRLDYRIVSTSITPEETLEVKFGDSIKDTSSGVLASVQILDDVTKPNYLCAADVDNSKDKDRTYSVILLSKINPLEGEALQKAKKIFLDNYSSALNELNIKFDELVFVDCGYLKVLNHGADKRPSMASFRKKMIGTVSSPLFGVGRLEMIVRKPSKKSVIYNIINNNAHSGVKSYSDGEAALNNYTRSRGVYSKLKSKKSELESIGEPADSIVNEMAEIRERMNSLPSVGVMRKYTTSLMAFSQWVEIMGKINELREAFLSSDGTNHESDEIIKSQISCMSLEADKIAIEHGLAHFRTVIFKPDEIVRINFNKESVVYYLNKFFKELTKSGSYAGVYLRVMDSKGATVKKLGYYFECVWLGKDKVSTAIDAFEHFVKSSEQYQQIIRYIEKGLYFELVPYLITGASKKDATESLSRYWLGDNKNPAMRDFFYDPISNEGLNTLIAVSRRKTRNQDDSEFLASVAPTSAKNIMPNEFRITNSVSKVRKVREKEKVKKHQS